MKTLVFTSAGDNTEFFKIWLSPKQTFDVFIVYYGDNYSTFKTYSRYATYIERRKGSKFQNFYYFYGKYKHIIDSYDYIFILDDDIVIQSCDIERMFQYASKYNLLICQPSFSKTSKVSHSITKHIDNAILSYTNFVEVNTCLFKKEALVKLMEKYDRKLIGWGIDYLAIFANGQYSENTYAVIHDIVCTNPYEKDKKIQRKELFLLPLSQDNEREQAWLEFAKQFGYYSYELKIYTTLYRPTRSIWLNTLVKIIEKPLTCISQLDFRKFSIHNSPLNPTREKSLGYLECFARIFAGISPWLASQEPAEEDIKTHIKKLVIRCFETSCIHFDKEFDIFSHEQSIVECAYICYGFLISNHTLWKELTNYCKTFFITTLRKVRLLSKEYHTKCNWYLFHGMIEVFLQSIGEPFHNEYVIDMIHTVHSWYCGDGVYFDGNRKFKMDYYNSYVIHPFFIEILKHMNSPLLEIAIQRSMYYTEYLERIVGVDGSYPPLGRSVIYRFATFHLLSYSILHQTISTQHSYGQLQNALTKVLTKLMTEDIYTTDGFLELGLTSNQSSLADSYSNTGSCYMTTLGFLPLGLQSSHPFWSDNHAFTQELCWKSKEPFKKYSMHNNDVSQTIMFVFHGESEPYCKDLVKYLRTNYHLQETIFCKEVSTIPENKIIVTLRSDFELNTQKLDCRIIDIYIGTDETMECLSILSYLDTEKIQYSLNSFCLKCLQPKRVLLVSPGGSACTAFLEFLQDKHITINTPNSFILGGDGLKHCRDESYLVAAYDPTHVLYQYGDLDKTIRSLFRRSLNDISYFYEHNQKFMNPLMRKGYREIKFETFDTYISHVLQTKTEPLGIIKHWKSWKASSRNVMFFHYEEIDERIDDFLGLAKGTCSAFTIRERTSKRLDIETDEYLEIICRIDREERDNAESLSQKP